MDSCKDLDVDIDSSDIEDNLTQQCEEIQALSAIYGDDFIVTDEASRMYEVRVMSEIDSPWSITIQLLLPAQYPNKAPPVFEIYSTWMNRAEKRKAMDCLYTIYRENNGEILLFQWVEKLRELVNEKARDSKAQEEMKGINSTPTDTKPEIVTEEDTEEVEEDTEEVEEDTEDFPIDEKSYMYIKNNFIESPRDSNNIEIMHGEPFTDRKSTFQSHLAFISNDSQVKQVLEELKKNRKVANASHNIMAYRIYSEDRNAYIQDCDDDGEYAAGPRLLHLLEILKVKNVIIIVSRWYGGILLGPDRFKHINNSARDLIKAVGLIESKESSEKNEAKGKNKFKAKKHK